VAVRRPRWHDLVIALAVAAVAAGGVWAFWGRDLRRAFGGDSNDEDLPAPMSAPSAS
jgi:hypothetical protein